MLSLFGFVFQTSVLCPRAEYNSSPPTGNSTAAARPAVVVFFGGVSTWRESLTLFSFFDSFRPETHVVTENALRVNNAVQHARSELELKDRRRLTRAYDCINQTVLSVKCQCGGPGP